MTAVWVSALVLAAGVVLQVPPSRRLRRLTVADAGRSGMRHWPVLQPRWWPPVRSRPPASDPARTVGELAALLRAGLPPGQAWRHVAGEVVHRRQFDDLLLAAHRAAAAGGDVPAVLRAGAARCRGPGEASAAIGLAASWQVAERTGAPTARVLERLAEGLRAEADVRGARAAAMAGPRATGRLLAWLPVGGLVIGQLIGADPVTVLVGTPLGRVCGLVGTVLAAGGALWTRRLVRAASGDQ